MATVAVAGGTGQLGRAIVEEIIKSGGQELLILARESNDAKAKEIGARIVAIDYNNADSIVTALEENKVGTVISTLGSMAGLSPELALIEASNRATTTQRYIPSLWGIKYTPEVATISPAGAAKVLILNALAATSLEYTKVMNGLFMDYYGPPYLKTYLNPFAFAVDMANNAGGIPGSGNVSVVFTHTFDVGRLVAALLTLSKWNDEYYIIGDKVTWNEVIQMAQEAKGVTFDVKYDSMDKLKQGRITELPAHVPMYPFFPKEQLQGLIASLGVLLEGGYFDFEPTKEQNLNEIFPDIKTKTMKEVIGAWKGK